MVVFETVFFSCTAESGAVMCDMGCSSGVFTMQFAELFPKSQIYGLDISDHSIKLAKQASEKKSLTNCYFHVADICNMSQEWKSQFDYMFMFDVLHDLPSVSKALHNIKEAMKPGAYFSVIDIALHKNLRKNLMNPWAPCVYGCSLFHCIPVSLNTGDTTDGGYGSAWGMESALECLQRAGFVASDVVQEVAFQAHILSRKK